MNFCAGAVPPVEALNPKYFDNSGSTAAIPVLHPLFMASTREVVGAWATLYAAGATKEEVIKHTFVHHTYDAIFYGDVEAGSTLSTSVMLAGLGPHRASGSTHFLTAMETTQLSSATNGSNDGAGAVVTGRSWWGGVVLGLGPVDGIGKYMDSSNGTAAPPPRPSRTPQQPFQKHRIVVPPGQAHIFDGCIRDPRNVKARSADINPHTNIGFALKAGLKGRTLNGMCLLTFVLPAIFRAAAAAAGCRSSNAQPHTGAQLERIGCTFSNPVIMEYTAVDLDVHITASAIVATSTTATVHFHVYDQNGKRVLRDGFAVVSFSCGQTVNVEASKL